MSTDEWVNRIMRAARIRMDEMILGWEPVSSAREAGYNGA